jgi:hypothetical protein
LVSPDYLLLTILGRYMLLSQPLIKYFGIQK